jgi:hypothetical protein
LAAKQKKLSSAPELRKAKRKRKHKENKLKEIENIKIELFLQFLLKKRK